MRKVLIISLLVFIVGGSILFYYYVYVSIAFVNKMDECGFDYGPFVAQQIDTVMDVKPDEIVDVKHGKLLIYNSKDSLPPIIGFEEQGEIIWNLIMDTSDFGSDLWEVSNVEVKWRDNPIRIEFIGTWGLGAERGTMKIDRKTAENTYCLSW